MVACHRGWRGGRRAGGPAGPREQGCAAEQHSVEDAASQVTEKVTLSLLRKEFQIKDRGPLYSLWQTKVPRLCEKGTAVCAQRF